MITVKQTALETTCKCGTSFFIDMVGLAPSTRISCPSCGNVDHMSATTIRKCRARWENARRKAGMPSKMPLGTALADAVVVGSPESPAK